MDATLAGHLQELRRGTVVVASLTVLRTPGYGYSLLETLSEAGFASLVDVLGIIIYMNIAIWILG